MGPCRGRSPTWSCRSRCRRTRRSRPASQNRPVVPATAAAGARLPSEWLGPAAHSAAISKRDRVDFFIAESRQALPSRVQTHARSVPAPALCETHIARLFCRVHGPDGLREGWRCIRSVIRGVGVMGSDRWRGFYDSQAACFLSNCGDGRICCSQGCRSGRQQELEPTDSSFEQLFRDRDGSRTCACWRCWRGSRPATASSAPLEQELLVTGSRG